MPDTSFRGPLMGTPDSMAGALDGAPIAAFGRTKWAEYFNDFSSRSNDYVTATQPAATAGASAVVRSQYDWSLTQIASQGVAQIAIGSNDDDYGFGYLRIYNASGDDDSGAIVQLDINAGVGQSPIGTTPQDGTASLLASDAAFVSRFNIESRTTHGIFVGLAESQAGSGVMATADGGVTSDNHIGFAQKSSDEGNIYFTAAGTAVANAVTVNSVLPSALENSEYVEVAVRLTGTKHYRGYVRPAGQKNAWRKVADGMLSTGWDAQLLISFANITTEINDDLQIDYVYFSHLRDRIA